MEEELVEDEYVDQEEPEEMEMEEYEQEQEMELESNETVNAKADVVT